MNSVIYEPKGRAGEYSPLAVNLFKGCLHGCKYCYAPGITFTRRCDFHRNIQIRENILKRLEKDCQRMAGDPREIFLCFTTDPYQPHPALNALTREALLILEKYNMKVQILTKAGNRAQRDFHILKRNNWKFGTTLHLIQSLTRKFWEPNAASLHDRFENIKAAHEEGIYTWVSVEPVIYPSQALAVIKQLIDYVDFWRIGKINYHKYIEERIDWKRFLCEVKTLLNGRSYYIKKDLLACGLGNDRKRGNK